MFYQRYPASSNVFVLNVQPIVLSYGLKYRFQFVDYMVEMQTGTTLVYTTKSLKGKKFS